MLTPQFTTQVAEDRADYGKFILEPLPVGLGNSLGNALRRTLLSSIKGIAVTYIKVDNASHLFTTIKGVKESVLEIALNVKKLRFQATGEGPFRLTLTAKKPGKLYGRDVEGEAKVVSEDLYIAEITDDRGKLELEAIAEVGVGYSPAEDREKREFGFIPVDAFFSPVKRVNFKVEEARVGRKSNLDRLILEIWTDGSIKPVDALRDSSNTLASYVSYILSGKDVPQQEVTKSESQKEQEAIDKKLYEIIIDELNLPSRVINALLRENIETVADLVKVGREKLTNMKGVGKKSIELIEVELNKMGIELK